MIRLFLLPLLVGGVILLAGGACSAPLAQTAAAVPPPAAAEAAPCVFMWRIVSPTATVHLLGSIHVAQKELYPLDPAIRQAFAQADALVLEIDLSAVDEGAMAVQMLRAGSLPAGQSLANVLPADVNTLLEGYLASRGLNGTSFNGFRPWFVAVNLSMIEAQKLGFSAELGIDLHFLNQARGVKEILQLESVEQQLALFSGLAPEVQVLLLKSTLLEADEFEESMLKMTEAWVAGDSGAIEAYGLKTFRENPDLAPVYKALMTDRNIGMADKVAGYLAENRNYFVIVGAAHLVGPDSVIALLEAKGFKAEQVKAAGAEERQ